MSAIFELPIADETLSADELRQPAHRAKGLNYPNLSQIR